MNVIQWYISNKIREICSTFNISTPFRYKYSSLFSGKITEDISKTAKDAAESIADTSSRLGQTSAFKTISQVKYLCYIFT